MSERLASGLSVFPVPFIFPSVLYHGHRRWTAPTNLSGLIDIDPEAYPDLAPYVPQMRYFVEDLRRRPVEEVLEEATTLPPRLGLMMALFRTLTPGRSLQAVFALCKPLILQVLRISAEALWQFIHYIKAVRRQQLHSSSWSVTPTPKTRRTP